MLYLKVVANSEAALPLSELGLTDSEWLKLSESDRADILESWVLQQCEISYSYQSDGISEGE